MDLSLVIDLIWKVGTLLGFGWMYIANRNKVTNARITELKDDLDVKMDNHSDRLARLEQDGKHAPTHNDIQHLHSRIDDLVSGLKRIEGESSAQTRILNLVYESLITPRSH